jgi:hypothetical protein
MELRNKFLGIDEAYDDISFENLFVYYKREVDFWDIHKLIESTLFSVFFIWKIAPEIINYEAIGFATDMWAVGCIAYIM